MHKYESFDIHECVDKIRALGELGLDWTASSQVIDEGSVVYSRIYSVISPNIVAPTVTTTTSLIIKPTEDPLPGGEDDTD